MKVKQFDSEEEINEFLANMDVEVVSITPLALTKTNHLSTTDWNLRSNIVYILQYEDVKALNDEKVGILFDMVWTGTSLVNMTTTDQETCKEQFIEVFKQWYQRVILQQNTE